MKTDPNYLSDCHNAAVYVVGTGEGTNHYECLECKQSCNFHPATPTNTIDNNQGHYVLSNPPQVMNVISIDRLEEILIALMNSVTGDGKYKRLPSMTKEQAHAEITEYISDAINKTIMEARIEGSIAENQKRPGYRYLSREIKKERQFIYDQLQNGNMPKLLHAQLDYVYRWFEARLPVAKLIDKDRVDELRQQIAKKYGRADNE